MAPVALLVMGITLATTYFVQAAADGTHIAQPEDSTMGKQSLRNVDTIVQQQLIGRGLGQRRLPPDVPPLYQPGRSPSAGDALFDVTPIHPAKMLMGFWNSWSDWSLCSRSCGGGVAKRYRHCGEGSPTYCEGAAVEYILCNTLNCPARSPSFREVQCTDHGNRLPHTRKYKWSPYTDDGMFDCHLYCVATELHITHRFATVIDGTRCGKGDKDLCIAGECVKLGCDMILGSTIAVDACGVCGGNNATCFHVKDEFKHLPDTAEYFNYYEVKRIPIGATHIFVRDNSSSYLTLMEADEHFEQYIVNGNRVLSWPGEFETAGTSVLYNRYQVHVETFEIPGPTKKDLYIMILYLGEAPKIEYEYWIPRSLLREEYGNPRESFDYDYLDVPEVTTVPTAPVTTTSTTTTTSTRVTTTMTTSTTPEPTTMPKRTITKNATKVVKQHGALRARTSIPLPLRQPKRCGKCKRPRNRKIYYCQSDFAIHARIVSKSRFQHGRNIRYDVEVVTTYKSDLKLMDREYIWVPSTCCPKLRPLRYYLLMGRKEKVDITDERMGKRKGDLPVQRRYETRLMITDADYWASWKKPYERTMAKVANKLNCQKFMGRKGKRSKTTAHAKRDDE